jgi:DNA-binding beta-propeller fold protein YncE
MNKGLRKQVSAKSAAVAILVVIILVQAVWWRFLVYRPKGPPGGFGGGAPMGVGEVIVTGRPDAHVETLAGGGDPGFADGPQSVARFDAPTGIAACPDGSLLIADTQNHRIRRLTADGEVTTVAGGAEGFADGPVAQARFSAPCGVTVGPDGAIYVADAGNNRVRRVRDRVVSTLAGGFDKPCGIAYRGGGQPSLLVAEVGGRRVRHMSLTGVISGGWAAADRPTSVADSAGRVAAATQSAALVGMAGPQGSPAVAENADGSRSNPSALRPKRLTALCAAPGGWYAADATQGAVLHIHDGLADVVAGSVGQLNDHRGYRDSDGAKSLFSGIGGLAVDAKGRILVADTHNNAIRRITIIPGSAEVEIRRGERERRGFDQWMSE